RTIIPKGKAFLRFLSDDSGIFRFVGEGGASSFRIAIQDAAAIDWKVKPFVRIERDRIGFPDRGEQRARRWCERSKPAVSTVNVQPKIEAPCDFADLRKRIESAGRDGSGVGHYANRQMPGCAIFFNRGNEFMEIDFVTFIDADQTHVVVSDAEQCRSFGDGMMSFFGSINTQRFGAGLRSFILNFRQRFALRAAASAAIFAIDPPLTKSPAASRSKPMICLIQSMVSRSISTAAGAERQAVRFAFSVDESRSAKAAMAVPGACT